LSPDGVQRLAELVREDLEGGTIMVGDGDGKTASAPIEMAFVDDGLVRVSATFGESDAVFEWRERAVLTKDGIVFDVETEDGGRKILGAVWDVEVEIEITPTAVVD
jgi:hypothetical protein